MPTYTVQAPSGKTYTVEGPEGATPEQLGQFILSQNQDERVALTRAQMAKEYSPAAGMGVIERLRAGAGKGLTDMARGAGQWVGAVSRDDVREARALDAPLDSSFAGKAGNFIGKAVPTAAASVLLPGSGSLVNAGLVGAASGAVEPSESAGETLTNIALGGLAGTLGQKIGNSVSSFVSKRAQEKAAQFAAGQAANAQTLQAARNASQAGYVIPPSDVQPQGALVEALSGLSGKIKTAQTASAKNQGVTDTLARKAVGLNADDELTRDALAAIRSQAGEAYRELKTLGTLTGDQRFNNQIAGLKGAFEGAAKDFPGLAKPELSRVLDSLKQPEFKASSAIDAIRLLRELSDEAYASGSKGTGKAFRAASQAMEDLVERNLLRMNAESSLTGIMRQGGTVDDIVAAGVNNPAAAMLDKFRQARQLIAKTYSIEKALNSETGSVSAQKLADQLKRGAPLSSELRTIAEAGSAFPKATQMLKESPKQLSPLDFGAAGLGLMGSGGNPLAALGLVARPGVRSLLLSPAAQSYGLRDMAAPTSRLADLASNPLARLVYGPAGSVAAVDFQK